MSLIKEAAEKTIQNAYEGEKPQIVIEIIMIISIIVSIIGIIQRCEAAKNVPKLAQKSSIKGKWLTKRVIKKHLTREQYKSEGDKVLKGLFTTAAKSTPEEMEEMFKEAEEGNITV